jgi:sec-independent protein translocase protein TatC
MQLLLLFGLAFELPVVIVSLGYFQVISSSFLRSKRRHAIVVILILAAALTPGPDVFSQIIMAIPMIILYELCVWIVWLFEKRRLNPRESNTK